MQRPPPRPAALWGLAAALLVALGWLLARLVWLWLYFGLFFFLLAAILGGSVLFRFLRETRPWPAARLARWSTSLALTATASVIGWEYRYIRGTIGDAPLFADARNALIAADQPHTRASDAATQAFRDKLRSDYPPGGVPGYIRWVCASGRMELSIGDLGLGGREFRSNVTVDHRGLGWLFRTAVALAFLWLGLWWSMWDLRLPAPRVNLIDPEEAEELEQAERREMGDPCHFVFDHTADIGIEAHARDWPGALEESARGLMACIGYLVSPAGGRGELRRIDLQAATREDLLHDWLAELLFCFETARLMPVRFKFRRADEQRIVADVHFRPVDPDNSRFRREVKAVTYHGIEVSEEKRKMVVRVIVDI
ncbi:MAG: archease [Phycisphaerae bacterium]|nr:archease [Phycisphaerae bacterium]